MGTCYITGLLTVLQLLTFTFFFHFVLHQTSLLLSFAENEKAATVLI